MNSVESNNSERSRRITNRRLLQKATTEYFETLSPLALEEECSLVESLTQASNQVNFDEDTEDSTLK
jgi:hypothetical protein